MPENLKPLWKHPELKVELFFFKDYDPQGRDGAIMGVAFYILINREKSLKIFSINKKLNLERKKSQVMLTQVCSNHDPIGKGGAKVMLIFFHQNHFLLKKYMTRNAEKCV